MDRTIRFRSKEGLVFFEAAELGLGRVRVARGQYGAMMHTSAKVVGERSTLETPLTAATAPIRVWTCSFSRMLWTWFFTVDRSIRSSFAICLLENPAATRSRISRSRAVNRACGDGRNSDASARTRLTTIVRIRGEHTISSRTTL